MVGRYERNSPVVLILAIIILISAIGLRKQQMPDIEEPTNIKFDSETKTIYLDSLTLKQKIAQMIIGYGDEVNKEVMRKMFIGGIYFDPEPTRDGFVKAINNFQRWQIVPLFIAADMEGCWNPFDNFQKFPAFKDIETKEQAYEAGFQEGELMKELGFNINFAPVLDLEDKIWKCRSFSGNPEEIAEKANMYIDGLRANGIIATAKHYPGKTLVGDDPHRFVAFSKIEEEDMLPFESAIKNNVSAIMISHKIVTGFMDSESKPSVVSEKLVKGLRGKFSGLIITDEIRMGGLKKYYSDINKMYVDLFRADNDIILDFDRDPSNIYKMISVVEDAINRGEISEGRIDRSIERIFTAKGISITK